MNIGYKYFLLVWIIKQTFYFKMLLLFFFSSEKYAFLVKKLSLLPWQRLGRYLRYFARVSFISICSHTISFNQIHVSFHKLPESYIDHYLRFQDLHLISPFLHLIQCNLQNFSRQGPIMFPYCVCVFC